MTTHDPRLVAQCAEAQRDSPHVASCHCDCCHIIRGEPTNWPRVYVKGVPVSGGGTADAPWRRTIVGRVVRWARAAGRLD